MKKIVIIINIIILISVCININNSKAANKEIDYTETLETFNNPERGFYTPVYIKYNEKLNTFKARYRSIFESSKWKK